MVDLDKYVYIKEFYPVNKGSYLGIATVELKNKFEIRLRIIKAKSGNIFATLPTDRVLTDDNVEFVKMIKFHDREFERELCDYVARKIKEDPNITQ